MADLRAWWQVFIRPCPYGLRTLAGAALAALTSAALLLLLHLGFHGWQPTADLFPGPISRAARWVSDFPSQISLPSFFTAAEPVNDAVKEKPAKEKPIKENPVKKASVHKTPKSPETPVMAEADANSSKPPVPSTGAAPAEASASPAVAEASVPWRRPEAAKPRSFNLVEAAREAVRTWRAGTGTFVRAPLSDDALPYSDSPSASLAEATRQVDYAITQTMLRLDLDWSSFHLISLESGRAPDGRGSYLFQRLRIYLPPASRTGLSDTNLAAHLSRMVSIWCERAVVEQPSPMHVRVLVDGTLTHEIFLSSLMQPLPPEPPEQAPRLTLVIDDMGASPEAARQLLALGLPLTFSVWPRSAYAAQVAETAWRAGQEVLIHQPCEPREYPAMQPGPGAVFVRMNPEEIEAVFRENVRRVPHAVGFNNHMGSRVTADKGVSRVLCRTAAEAGLFVLDSLTHPTSVLAGTATEMGITAYQRAVFLDDPLLPQAIRGALRLAERLAKAQGQVIAIGHPHPETIAALREWSVRRDTSIHLVPLRLQRPFAPK